MVSSEGIRANPKKTKAIADMQSPRTLKEMRILSRKLAALKRLLSRSAKKLLPFFETLKDITKENKDEYSWTESAKKAFQEMKQYIVGLPLLTTHFKEETLYVYLAAATKADTERGRKKLCPHGKVGPIIVTHVTKTTKVLRGPPHQGYNRSAAEAGIEQSPSIKETRQYSVELGAYNITYEPRNAIKGQVLADFLSEALVGTYPEEFFRLLADVPNQDDVEKWILFTDGASNSKGSRVGLVLISPSGVEFTYALGLNFTSTNNEVKYEALLAGLCMAKKMNVQDIDAKVDSKLVASHINGSYVASSTSMVKYLGTAKECIAGFRSFVIQNIPRNLNQKADILSKLATHAFDHLTKKVLVEVLAEQSTDRKEVSVIVEEEEDNWMTPIIRCLAEGVWLKDKEEKRALRMKINQPTMSSERYTWDPAECISGQVPRCPKTLMTSIMAPWPFYQWGMDILGPLPRASRKLKFIIVAIDYFTKWIEAKPLARITKKDANRLVERANKSLMEGIKARLGMERAGWVDEIPNVLWAHRTSLKQSNGETPFSLTYGSEVVILAEIGMPTHRTMMIREYENEDDLRLNMDLLQERREAAAIREAKYKTKMEQYYNQKVRPMSFKLDEYVFQKNEANRVEDQGKLGPKWEGPYRSQWPSDAHYPKCKTFRMSPRANGQVTPLPGTQDVPDESKSQWPNVPDESKSQWPSGARYLERKTFRMSPRANGQVSSLPGMQDIPDESKSQWPSDVHYPERKTFQMSPRANGQVTPITRNARRFG
ncbi:reverse transcriptase domain-containing protein [Tanacetum coccineum]